MAQQDHRTSNLDKPLPSPVENTDPTSDERNAADRPGTSGTELFLVSKTREASDNYKKAQQAEQAYKFKKRAAGARQHRSNIKIHFKQSVYHFKEAMKALWQTITAVPAVMRAKSHERKAKAEAKRRQRDVEKKRELDERLREIQLSEAEAERRANEKLKEEEEE